MDYRDFFPENEQPLDRLVNDGGFSSIFRTFACVGDSLSSGEFQIPKEDGKWGYYDKFEYSWGQFMARTLGSKVYNFSKGGMTAKHYLESFADSKGYFNVDLKCQAYIIALGVNDIFNQNGEIGSVADIKENWKENAPTFAGYYGAIVQRYKAISPDAKFFFVTPPKDRKPDWTEKGDKITELLYEMAKVFPNSYVIDLHRYAPACDEEFRAKFFLNGHMNPMGYALMAKIMMSYIDYIIRHNMTDFNMLGFAAH